MVGRLGSMITETLAANTFLLAEGSAVPPLGMFGWIIIGGLAGWIGSKIMGTDEQMGLFLNIVVGIIGGFLGGWVLGLLGVGSGGWFWSFLTCLLGACILLFIVGLVTGNRKK